MNPTHSNLIEQPAGRLGLQSHASQRILYVKIPDSEGGVDFNDLNVRLSLHFRDDDTATENDNIDLLSSRGFPFVHELSLLGDAANPGQLVTTNPISYPVTAQDVKYLVWNDPKLHKGNEGDGLDRDENGQISISAGDSLPKFFMDAVKAVQGSNQLAALPSGSCTGAQSCV